MTGKNIKVRVDAAVWRIFNLNVDDTSGEIDETDGESGGYGDYDDSGIREANVTFESNLRSADGAPYTPGTLLEDVLVAMDGNVAVPVVNKRYLFPKLKIMSVSGRGETKGKITYSFTCRTSGVYYAPGEEPA